MLRPNIPAAEIRVAFGLMHAYVLRIGQLAHGLLHIPNSDPDWPLFNTGVYLLGSGLKLVLVSYSNSSTVATEHSAISHPLDVIFPQNNTERILHRQIQTVTPFELLTSPKDHSQQTNLPLNRAPQQFPPEKHVRSK
jgi:hypothetical protein